jgi:hypothetical protein
MEAAATARDHRSHDEHRRPRIEDHGLIGDLQTAALVGRDVPQAISHLTLVLAARDISGAQARERPSIAERDGA